MKKKKYVTTQLTAGQRIWRDRYLFLMLLPSLVVSGIQGLSHYGHGV